MCGASALTADVAFRAVSFVRRVFNTACLAAFYTNRAVVLGIRRMMTVLDGCATLVALGAILGLVCLVFSTFDLLVAVLANRAVAVRDVGRVLCRILSGRTANRAGGITNVNVGVRRVGDGLSAVFANQAVAIQRLVSVAGTNVAASVFTGDVVLVCIAVGRHAIISSACAVAICVALVGIQMSQCRIAFTGLRIVCAADTADLFFNLCLGAGSGIQRGPFIKIMRDLSGVSAAVTFGIACVVKIVTQRLVALAGLRAAAGAAGAGFDLGIQAIGRSSGCPIAEIVILFADHTDEVATLAVTICIAVVIVSMTQRSFADHYLFCTADVAESVQQLCTGAACRDLGCKFGLKFVLDRSRVIALRAVAGNVAIVIIDVAEWFACISRLLCTAKRAGSCFNGGSITVSSGLDGPFAEAMNVFTLRAAVVADLITGIVIHVIGYNSYGTADVTVSVTGVIVGVRLRNSELAANVTIRIASGCVYVVGGHSECTADIAGGIASVGILMSTGDSERAANLAGLCAIVYVNVVCGSDGAAEVTVGIAIVAVNMIGSHARFAAGVTICIAEAGIGVCSSTRALLTASITDKVTIACVGVFDRLTLFAASVAFRIGAALEGVLGFRLTRYAIAFVAGRVAGRGVIVILSEAACKCKEHQHQRQCAK